MSASPFNWLPGGAENDQAEADPVNRNMAEEAQRALVEQARLFFDVMSVGRGPELLAHLRDRTIEMPLLMVNGVAGSQPEIGMGPAEWAYYREGQNSITRYIEKMCVIAMQSENKEPDNV